MIYDVLCKISKELNKENILWGVGASLLLNQYGLSEDPKDIDLLVSLKDIHKCNEILSKLGTKRVSKMSLNYATEYFLEYVIDDYDIDVMSGLMLNHVEGSYSHCFDEKSIIEFKCINGIEVPFTTLEEWYVIYQLIPGREKKVDKIEKYFIDNGLKNVLPLKRMLLRNLPKPVIRRINYILENCTKK